MSRGVLASLVFTAVIGTSTLASASAASRLAYSRTPGAARCPDERAFRSAVAERLGYDPFFPWAEQTVTVDIFEEKGSLRGKLSLVGRDGIVRGTRELKGGARDCDDLLASLALATSITLDPMAVQMGGRPPAEPDARNPAQNPAQSVPANALAPKAAAPSDALRVAASPNDDRPAKDTADDSANAPRASDSRARMSWALLAGPLVAVGETPNPSLGARLGGEARYGHWRLGAELRGDLPTSESAGTGASAHVGVVGGALAPCYVEGLFAACGLVYLGSMQSRGSGVEIPVEESLFFAAAGARLEMNVPFLSPVELRLHVDGMKSLIESSFFLHGREVWKTPPFWAAMGVSAAVRFP